MLLILDSCNLALASEPSGGVTIRVSGIEGLPNTTLLIPIVKDSADQLYAGMGEFLGRAKVFTQTDLRKEAQSHGNPISPTD